MMDELTRTAIDFPMGHGACAAGIATVKTLAGGPPSSDLSYVLPGAKAAISFALPLDQRTIPLYLMKKDRLALEKDYNHAEIAATGLGVHFANYLTKRGFPSVHVAAGQVYREDSQGGPIDVDPEVFKEYLHEEAPTMVPDIALKYLAVASGVGALGLSGNVLTRKEGSAIVLGAVVTTADLDPTDPIPEEENYCDDCRLCVASCVSGLMDPEEKTIIRLGCVEHRHATKRSISRCQMVCGGLTGLHPSGKWSTWSPGRFRIPEKDDDMMPLLARTLEAFYKRPDMEGGVYHHVLIGKKYYMSCSNCQLVCAPEKEERTKRYKMLVKGGCVVQNPEDGSMEALPADEARERVAAMSPEARGMYEDG
jgi:epoxyqueuosine reductase